MGRSGGRGSSGGVGPAEGGVGAGRWCGGRKVVWGAEGVGGRKGWGPEGAGGGRGGASKGRGPEGWGASRFFVSLPPEISFFLLSGGSSRGILVAPGN